MKTKDFILQTAGEEFAKYGFDAVSMNDLVKKLDINKATIYYHFKDKRTLYHEVIKNEIGILNSNIEAIFDESKDALVLLKDYIKAMICTIKDNPNVVQIALREIANYGANIDESFIPFIEKELELLKKIINSLDLKDEYKDINIFTIYALINGTIKTFYAIQMSQLPLGIQSIKQDSEKSLDYISEFVSNILIDAIVKK